MTRRRAAPALVAAALLGVTAVAGCTAPIGHASARASSAGPTQGGSSQAGSSGSGSSGTGGSTSGASTSGSSASRSPTAGATASSASPSSGSGNFAPASTALGTGERAWAAFSRRGLSQARWWAALSPLLSESARATYVYDDPRNLPQLNLKGTIRLAAKAPSDPDFTAAVVVPTNRGAFHLDLERHTRHSPWLLYAIVFPGSVR